MGDEIRFIQCPVCGGKNFKNISVRSPSGHAWLSSGIKGCKHCGCIFLDRVFVEDDD